MSSAEQQLDSADLMEEKEEDSTYQGSPMDHGVEHSPNANRVKLYRIYRSQVSQTVLKVFH